MVLWRPVRPSRTNTKKDVLFIIGNWNANVGSQEILEVTVKFGLGIQNEAGQRLTVLPRGFTCHSKPLFQQHKRWLYTWTSPDGQHWNQIDSIICSWGWRNSIQAAKTTSGAYCCSDHELLIVKFRFKLNKVEKTIRPFSSVQLLRCIRLSATPWTAACQASLSITNSRSLPKLMSTESVMPSNHLILCCPLLLLLSIFPSITVFSKESAFHIRWPKYWSFSINISPSNEHPGLISFRMDWLHLLAVQGTLTSLLQHHNSKASILRPSAFFTVQISHPYMTTGKTIALTRRTFVDKVMSLLFNMLSTLVITFLPKSKCFYFHGYSHHLQWFWSPEK